jgi:hypothetical protein
MTSKEKAIELVNKYTEIDVDSVDTIEGIIKIYIDNDKAKQCALIAVEQLIEHSYQVMKTFWKEVKTEIEKL